MRTVSGMMLAAAVGLATGCGSNPPPAEPTTPLAAPAAQTPSQPSAASGDPGPSALNPPKVDLPKTDPAPTPVAVTGWEMDPAKHVIPPVPVTGKLQGAAFIPEVLFQGDTLSFRVLKDGVPERQVSVRLPADKASAAATGLDLTIRQEQPVGPDVPLVVTELPGAGADGPTSRGFGNGYALTLKLKKRDGGKLPGEVYLSLPGDDKDFLAGTFAAEWVRSPAEPPGPDDAPFIHGKLTVAGGGADPQVKVGYAAQPKGDELVFGAMQMPFVGPNRWARVDNEKPRVTVLVGTEEAAKPGRYEHTHLPPGRYFVYAAFPDGPAVWKWLTVAADSQLTADFTLDAAKTGKLDVKLPAGTTGKVQLTPADDPGTPTPPGLALGIAISLGLEADAKDGAAKFEKLGPGRYEVRAGDLTDVVEVKAGETATAELKKK